MPTIKATIEIDVEYGPGQDVQTIEDAVRQAFHNICCLDAPIVDITQNGLPSLPKSWEYDRHANTVEVW